MKLLALLAAALAAGCVAPEAVEPAARDDAWLSSLRVAGVPPGLATPIQETYTGRIDLPCDPACSAPGTWESVSETWAGIAIPDGARRIVAVLTWTTDVPDAAGGEMGMFVYPVEGRAGGDAWGAEQPLTAEVNLTTLDTGEWTIEVMSWNAPPADVVVEVTVT